MEPEPSAPSGFDGRAFAWGFGVSAGGALIVILVIHTFDRAGEAAIAVMMYAAVGWVVAVVVLLGWALVEVLTGKWRAGVARLLGLVAGGILGFGTCMGILGV